MNIGRQNSVRTIKALETLRPVADQRIGGKSHVVGSMIGLKLRKGEVINRLGFTYFVREKILSSDLNPCDRIPKTLVFDDAVVSTDVVVWPSMTEQSGGAVITFDGGRQGTFSCFAASSAGLFGVSCAHCLVGIDGNAATPSSIALFHQPLGKFIPTGESVFLAYSPGPGLRGNFGYLDCGLFDLRESTFLARARNGKTARVVTDIRTLIGKTLVGKSCLNVPGAKDSERLARVIGIEATALGEKCDIVLSVAHPGTFRGDSGMLWLTEDGRAAALHARGEVMAGLRGSTMTTAIAAERVRKFLDIELLIG